VAHDATAARGILSGKGRCIMASGHSASHRAAATGRSYGGTDARGVSRSGRLRILSDASNGGAEFYNAEARRAA